MKVTLNELIRAISEENGITQKQGKEIINSTIEFIKDNLKEGNEVSLHGLGAFKTKTLKAGQVRNPKTGEYIEKEEREKLIFKYSTILKKEF